MGSQKTNLRPRKSLRRFIRKHRTFPLFLISPRSQLWTFLAKVVEHKVFDFFIFVIILASSIALTLEEPSLPSNSPLLNVLHNLDIVWACIFAFELVLRFLVNGVLLSNKAYLRTGWGILDLVTTVISIISVTPIGIRIKGLRILRVMRVARIARMHAGMRVLMEAMIKTIPVLTIVIVPYFFFLIIFSNIGLTMFVGQLWQCNNDTVANRDECEATYPTFDPSTNTSMSVSNGVWEKYRMNYDHFGYSILSVITISLQEGWPDDMHRMIDCVDIGRQPVRDANPQYSIFNVAAVFLGNWFFISVVQGVLIDNLKRNREIAMGIDILTKEQRAWMEWVNSVLTASPKMVPPVPTNAIQRWCQQFADSKLYTYLWTITIFVNTVVLCTMHANSSATFDDWQRTMEIVFTALYFVEALILLCGLGPRVYVHDPWNLLSLVILVFAIVNVSMTAYGTGPGLPVSAVVFYPVRLLRLMRLMKMMPGVVALMRTSMAVFSQLINVMFLMFLMYFVFAIIGMFNFGKVNIRMADSLNDRINFRDFPSALLTCYIISTGENWPGMMNDLSRTGPPWCSDANDDCGQPIVAPIFCLALQFIMSVILLNTFIAIVVDTFHDMLDQDDAISIRNNQIDIFCAVWTQFDPKATWWIDVPDLLQLFRRIQPSLVSSNGRRISTSVNVLKLVRPLHGIGVHNNRVYFGDVMLAYFKGMKGTALPKQVEMELGRMGQKRNFSKYGVSEPVPFYLVRATLCIQEFYRNRVRNAAKHNLSLRQKPRKRRAEPSEAVLTPLVPMSDLSLSTIPVVGGSSGVIQDVDSLAQSAMFSYHHPNAVPSPVHPANPTISASSSSAGAAGPSMSAAASALLPGPSAMAYYHSPADSPATVLLPQSPLPPSAPSHSPDSSSTASCGVQEDSQGN